MSERRNTVCDPFSSYVTICLGSDFPQNRDKDLDSGKVPVGADPRSQKWSEQGDQEEERQSKSMNELHYKCEQLELNIVKDLSHPPTCTSKSSQERLKLPGLSFPGAEGSLGVE